MDIDKSLYNDTSALPPLPMTDIELELPPDIGDPDVVELDDGGVEITFGKQPTEELINAPHGANLAEFMEEGELLNLSTELMELVEADLRSRKDWADTFVKGLEVLGFNYEERTSPFLGACGVFSTILAEAAIRFQAETMGETFPAAGPVKTRILGEETKEKEDAALRVKTDMNYELTEVMTEYRPEHERMLYSLGLAGSAFKKVYFDIARGRQTSVFLPAEDVVVPYGASHIDNAERITHVMRKTKNDLLRLQDSGFYRDVELSDPVAEHTDIEKKKAEEGGFEVNEDNRYTFYEIHTEYMFEELGDELPRPYIVTIDKSSGEVLSVYRNWEETDPLKKAQQHFVHYVYVPGFGFYGLGLIHIIGGYAKAGTSLIRQLVDAGTFANLPGGYKTRGLRVKGDDTPISPGEFRDVDVPSGALKENIMPLPFKEPSQTLLALLDRITEEGRRLGAISDMNISDMSAQAPVGTTLALLERTLKPMTAVQARVHYAMKLEFKLLKAMIARSAPAEYGYAPDRGEPRARRADYEMVEVLPVSDPNSSTMAQRVVQYQAVQQLSTTAPQIYDLPFLHRQMIEVLGVKNADKIVPTTEDILPLDPVSENMGVLTGKPIKAFVYQDHDAHIAAHMAFMQDPMISQMMGQNPLVQQIMSALHAHMAEHIAFSYRKQIEDTLGAPLPPPEEPLPSDIEVQLSRLVADAAKQLSASHQQQNAQKQAQEQAQDPMFKLQMEEVQIKKAEVQRKANKDKADIALEQGKLQLEREKAAKAVQKDVATFKQNERKTTNAMQKDVATFKQNERRAVVPPGVK